MKQEIAAEVAAMKEKGARVPHLAAILVGHDGGSETYVAYKIKDCEAVGFRSSLIRYEDDVTETELLAKIKELNVDDDLDGVLYPIGSGDAPLGIDLLLEHDGHIAFRHPE